MESATEADSILSHINKRIRGLHKKQKRIIQMEESLAKEISIATKPAAVTTTKPDVETLEMKAPEEMAAAAGGNFAPFPEEEIPNLEQHESDDNELGPVEEVQKLMVSGAFSSTYEINFIPGSSYFNGRIVYENGTTKDVSFVPFEKTKGNTIFDTCARNNISSEGLLIPHHYIYCRQISKYLICYDRFDCSLKEWLPRWIDCVKNVNGLPHTVIGTQISKTLKAIHNIHKKGMWHSSLVDISNYVLIKGDWHIINISGTLGGKSDKDQNVRKDFSDFRDMLKDNVLLDSSWQERNDFFQAFDHTNGYGHRYVQMLLNHVFTKTARERLQRFSIIYHGWRDCSYSCKLLSEAISNEVFHQYTDIGWDNVNMSGDLRRVYEHRENKHYENDQKNYDGKSIESLMKFLRNVYEHSRYSVLKDIEKEVRQLWPGFLEKLHLYFY